MREGYFLQYNIRDRTKTVMKEWRRTDRKKINNVGKQIINGAEMNTKNNGKCKMIKMNKAGKKLINETNTNVECSFSNTKNNKGMTLSKQETSTSGKYMMEQEKEWSKNIRTKTRNSEKKISRKKKGVKI